MTTALIVASNLAPICNLARVIDVLNGLDLLPVLERVAASEMLERFAAGTFGEESPEYMRLWILRDTLRVDPSAVDPAALRELASDLGQSEGAEPPPPASVFQTVPPLFTAGPVRFFQSTGSKKTPQVGKQAAGTDPLLDYGNYFGGNERLLGLFYQVVAGRGGVALGIGSLQNLSLAAAAEASALVVYDWDPIITLTLPLILPLIPASAGPDDFVKRASALVNRATDPAAFLEPIPREFRPIFAGHIKDLRLHSTAGPAISKTFEDLTRDPRSFLGDPSLFQNARRMLERGGITVIDGDFFAKDMPDLVASAMTFHREPITSLYLSNALEWAVRREPLTSYEPLAQLLDAPFIRRGGNLLTTTEFRLDAGFNRLPRKRGDGFAYHAMPLGWAARLLRCYGNLTGFVARFQSETGLKVS